jgi:hypothetical protein
MKVSMVKVSGSASPPVEGAAEEAAGCSSAMGVAAGLDEGLATGVVALPLGLGEAEGVLGLVGVVEEPPEPKRGGPGTV